MSDANRHVGLGRSAVVAGIRSDVVAEGARNGVVTSIQPRPRRDIGRLGDRDLHGDDVDRTVALIATR
jgi:hypothetical protein